MVGDSGPPGDRVFAELVDREFRGIAAAVAMIVGRPAVAEEITQDAFERAYARWHRVSTLERPGAWVRRVALNEAVSATRRAGAERRAIERLVRRNPPTDTTQAADPPDDALWAAVVELPTAQLRAVVMHYGADLAIDDIAREMELTNTAVKSLLFRARQELRKRIAIPEVVG